MTTKVSCDSLDDIRNEVHSDCFVCSLLNTYGMHISFKTTGDNEVIAVFQCDGSYQGYQGIVHGGVVSALLDGAMCNCMFACNKAAVTTEMLVKYRHPVVVDEEAMVIARIVYSSEPMYMLESEIIQNGKVKAIAKGKYYHKNK